MKKGFTLIEMLVVIGIIAILIGASIASFGKMKKSADNTQAQELVKEVATALTALYEADGLWPKKIREEGSKADGGKLDKDVALVLAKRGYMSLSINAEKTQLVGKDRFGIVTPWALKVIERQGTSASAGSVVGSSGTVDDHILRFAVDLDGDGIVEKVNGGDDVRATAVVWCVSKDGKSTIQSWTSGQSHAVK